MGPRGTMGDGRAEKAEAGKERVTGCNNNIKKKGGGGPLDDERGRRRRDSMDGWKKGRRNEREELNG